MSLLRKQIRANIKAALLNQTRAQDRVYANRPEVLSDEQLFGVPAIVIETPSERSVEEAEAPKTLKRTAAVNVHLLLTGAGELNDPTIAAIDDDLEDFAQEVESKLFALTEAQVGGELRYTGDSLNVDEKGRLPAGGMSLNFEVDYYQEIPETAPAPGITELDKVHVDYNLEGGAAVDASDEVNP